ncbi:MAG: lipocalin-like domain-containing protein [Actinomycetota bacterium]
MEVQQLVGTWSLTAWEIHTDAGTTTPYGATPTGMLTYTAEGTVQVAVQAGGRGPLSHPSPRRAPDAEVAEAARRFFAYSGTWQLADDVVSHHVLLALDPGMVGTVQRRRADLEGQQLTLSADEPVAGSTRRHVLRWQRFEADGDAVG